MNQTIESAVCAIINEHVAAGDKLSSIRIAHNSVYEIHFMTNKPKFNTEEWKWKNLYDLISYNINDKGEIKLLE